MTATITDVPSAGRGDATAAHGNTETLRRLQRRMLEQVASEPGKSGAVAGIAGVVREYVEPVAMFYFERGASGGLEVERQLHPQADDGRSARFAKQLRAACENACRTGELYVQRQAAPARVILAAPVVLRGSEPEAFGAVFPATASAELLVLLVQMAAAHLVLWHVLSRTRGSEMESEDALALLELLDRVHRADGSRRASYVLVNELSEHLGVRHVAVGLRRGGKGTCRLAAISGVARFDRRSASADALEAAMDEAVLHDEVVVWPPDAGGGHRVALSHKSLCAHEGAACSLAVPLHDDDGKAVGAMVLLDDRSDAVPSRAVSFLRMAEGPIATSFDVAKRLEGTALIRLARAAARLGRTWKGSAAGVCALLLLAAMAVPLPYKLHCDCRIEPVTRRFVAAPFEGTLEKALVKPGDLVDGGDLLARMDGREVRWKRAAVVADLNQATKKRDAAMAAQDSAEAQIAKLEMERLNVELQLLDHRAENLEIKSSMRGIVTSGDLERAEGAPLEVGQTLFEIAPLENMVVEVAVPDEDVAYVREGQPLFVRLDAYPGKAWPCEIMRVRPRAEIRDQDNVFVAEATLDNADSLLRPGMKGRAKVVTPRRPLGWILFHKPAEYLTKKLTW